jgi:CRP-like cAMP-binding protein
MIMNIKTLFQILRHLKIKSFSKGETIISVGEVRKEVFYIRKGLVRCYLINDKGEDITFQLFAEHQVFGNAHSILFDEPSRYIYMALEKTKVYSTDLKSFQTLTNTHTDLTESNKMDIGRRILKTAVQRSESFVFLTPEERYQKYIEDNPNIINRVPDKYIASVLGITPVSLSRIRSRIAAGKKK